MVAETGNCHNLPVSSLAERLKEARKRKGWTQSNLSAEAHVSQGVVSRYENGERGVTSGGDASVLSRMAAALEIRLDWLIKGEGPMVAEQGRVESRPAHVLGRDMPGWEGVRKTAELLLPPNVPPAYLDEAGDQVLPGRALTPFLVAKMAELLFLTEKRDAPPISHARPTPLPPAASDSERPPKPRKTKTG
jgi:transcriptional regulator with XRE-family HTH domain